MYVCVYIVLPCVVTNTMHVATCCHTSPHFATNIDYGQLRQFCEHPVCPEPVWKPVRAMRCPLPLLDLNTDAVTCCQLMLISTLNLTTLEINHR